MTKQLEDDLMEVGARLAAAPPADADDLLDLLDRTEILLSRVDQSPSESVYTALQPSRTALVIKDLLDHSDVDVKVSVASCITEFIRITAPSPPYDDDLMKVIFQVIVGIFEKLDDFTSRTYLKRVLILETIAKVQCCVVMLDLQCDGLILEMFHYFLKTIRSSHPQNVFSSMEFIMTLVLHESEDISSDLLLCLLDSVKNNNKDVPTISHRLGEKVISNCAAKLKDYLVRVQSAFAPCEYSKIIASIYQETSDALEQNESKLSGNNLGFAEMGQEVGSAERAPSVLNLPKSEVGRAGNSIDEPLPYDGDAFKMEQEIICISEEESHSCLGEKVQQATADDVKESASSNIDSKAKPVEMNVKRGSMNNREGDSSEKVRPLPYDGDALKMEQEVICISEVELYSCLGEIVEQATTDGVNGSASSTIDSTKPVELNVKRGSMNNREGDSSEKVRPATAEDVKENASSAIDSEAKPMGMNGKRGSINNKEGDSSKKEQQASANDGKENMTSTIDVEDKQVQMNGIRGSTQNKGGDTSAKMQQAIADDVKANATLTVDSEDKLAEMNCKRGSIKNKEVEGDPLEKMQQATAGDVKENATSTIDSDAKPVEMNGKRRSINKKGEGDSSEKKDMPDTKQRKGKGKVNAGTDLSGETSKFIPSPKSDMNIPSKDEGHLEDGVKSQSRRKRPRSHELSGAPTDNPILDQSLVGSKIKVWWPGDRRYYDGKVKSFDSKNGRHTIVYNDGDMEVLLLRKERFELLGPSTEIERQDQAKDDPLPLASPDGPRNKKGRANLGLEGGMPLSPSKSEPDTSNKPGTVLRNLRGRTKAGSSASPSGQTASKSEEDTPKAGHKVRGSGDDSKGATPDVGGKSRNVTVSARKLKVDSPPTNTKLKTRTPKTNSKQIVKDSKASGKSKDDSVELGKIDAQLTKASESTRKVGRKTMQKCTAAPKTAHMTSVEKGKEKAGANETQGDTALVNAQQGKKTSSVEKGKGKAGASETQGSTALVKSGKGKGGASETQGSTALVKSQQGKKNSSVEKGKKKVGAGSTALVKAQQGKKTSSVKKGNGKAGASETQGSTAGKGKAGASETQGSTALVKSQQGKKTTFVEKGKKKVGAGSTALVKAQQSQKTSTGKKRKRKTHG